MTTMELIQKTLERTGESQRGAAASLGVSRITLVNWMKGVYLPDPSDERVRRLADWSGEPYPRVMAMILKERGVSAAVIKEMGTHARSV